MFICIWCLAGRATSSPCRHTHTHIFSGRHDQNLTIRVALLMVACPLDLDTRNNSSRGIVQEEPVLTQRFQNATQSAHFPVMQAAVQPHVDHITRRKLHEITSFAALARPANGLKRDSRTACSIAEVCMQHGLQRDRNLLG